MSNLVDDLNRIQGRWLLMSVAAKISGHSTRTLKRHIRAIHDDSGIEVMKRWGQRGHWYVSVDAFASYMRHHGELAKAIYEIRDRVEDIDAKLVMLRNSHIKLRRTVCRPLGQQPTEPTTPGRSL